MSKRTQRLTLDRPARYRIQVVGHLDNKRAAWFECQDLVREYDEDGTPVTTMTIGVLDQAMLHGQLAHIRDLGLPLLAVNWVKIARKERECNGKRDTSAGILQDTTGGV